MPSFTLNVPDNKFQMVKDSLITLFPIPVEDNPNTGAPWTENQWLKKIVTTNLTKLVKEGRRRFRVQEGKDTFSNEESDFDDSFDIT